MDKVTIWQVLIPGVVPTVLMLLKVYVVPRIPAVALPILAPFLGAILEVINQYTSGNEIGAGAGVVGALLGGAGVCVREILDQVKKVNKS